MAQLQELDCYSSDLKTAILVLLRKANVERFRAMYYLHGRDEVPDTQKALKHLSEAGLMLDAIEVLHTYIE